VLYIENVFHYAQSMIIIIDAGFAAVRWVTRGRLSAGDL
jgi:hypothetical protein